MGMVCASPTPKGHTLPPVKRKGNQTTLMMLSSILFLVAAALLPPLVLLRVVYLSLIHI